MALNADGGLSFKFNTATSGDPGAGRFLFNNGNFLAATQLNIDEFDTNGNSLVTFLAGIDDSSSGTKAVVTCQKEDGSALFSFYITAALSDRGVYDTYPITPISSSGLVSNRDVFVLTFSRTGDLGTSGSAGRDTGLKYTYDSTTTAADPGAGKLRFNNATLASATALYISETDGDANGLAALLATWDDSTNTVKGFITLYKDGAPSNMAIFSVSGTLTDNGTWDTLTVANIVSSGAIANSDVVKVLFSRTGDIGATGAAAPLYTTYSIASLNI